MANVLDKSTIVSLGVITPGQVSQSVDAFTGIKAYDITISGSLTVTGSVNFTPNVTIANDLNIGNAGYIAGQPILTSAGATGFVTSVNGVLPSPGGNVSVALSSTITGNSASLTVSSSGANTGSLNPGTLWVISGDPDPTANGDAYIYTTSSLGAGQWLVIAPLDTAAGDARYIVKNGNDSHTGSLYISGSGIMLSVSGTLEVHDNINNVYSLNSKYRQLYDGYGSTSLDWGQRLLVNSSGINTIDYENTKCNDISNIESIDWNARLLNDSSNVSALTWDARQLLDANGDISANWDVRQLSNTSGVVIDWENRTFTGSLQGTSSWSDQAKSASAVYSIQSSTNTTYYPLMGTATTTGYKTLYSPNNMTFNPFTGLLKISGSLTVSGSSIITGSLTVSQNAIISGSVNITGSLLPNGGFAPRLRTLSAANILVATASPGSPLSASDHTILFQSGAPGLLTKNAIALPNNPPTGSIIYIQRTSGTNAVSISGSSVAQTINGAAGYVFPVTLYTRRMFVYNGAVWFVEP